MHFTFGLDPEYILTTTDGTPVSAINVLPPKRAAISLGNGGLLYYDNLLAEIAVPPASSISEATTIFNECILLASKHVKPFVISTFRATAFAGPDLEHPEARAFGCKPDYDAWETRSGAAKVCPPPPSIPGQPYRGCGGHIHIGCDIAQEQPIELVRLLDLIIGTALTAIDKSIQPSIRAMTYGSAGRFRPTPYGIEYRTPSNLWTCNPELFNIVYQLVDTTLASLYFNGVGPIPGDAKLFIDNCDNLSAFELFKVISQRKIDPHLNIRLSNWFVSGSGLVGGSFGSVVDAWKAAVPPPRVGYTKYLHAPKLSVPSFNGDD